MIGIESMNALGLAAMALLASSGGPVRGRIANASEYSAPLRVFAVPLDARADGAQPPPKARIYEAAAAGSHVVAETSGAFAIELGLGHHALFAYADLDGDGRWTPSVPEPIGWCAPRGSMEIEPIASGAEGVLEIRLSAPRPMPRTERAVSGGALRWIRGLPVVQLSGDAAQRGYAHGALLAAPIVDFFRFYVLEDVLGSIADYEQFAAFLGTHYALPEPYVTECRAVIEGMRASGADLRVAELGRDFALVDLYAINGYIETRAMRGSCTQFAAWGESTQGTDVRGGMITGRNMDGECDLRRVTVSHFTIFAVAPSEPRRKRYVSFMWPGFIGTLSGVNEAGFSTMEDAGMTGPGPVVEKLIPLSWTMREALAMCGGDATPERVLALLQRYDNAAGGTCGPGGILFCAVPYREQAHPAFVIEGDRFGERVRLPGDVAPHGKTSILASNHPRSYGIDPEKPELVFDKRPSFSSLWRYQAGAQKLEAWSRTGRRIGTAEMQELLQVVAQGTTEHAILVRSNLLEIEVALASLDAEPWDAPYRTWAAFHFEELFAR